MYLISLIFPVLIPVFESSDSIPEAVVVADRGIVVSQTDTLTLGGAISITDVMNANTSAFVNDNGGLAGLKTISLRGLGSAHTAIYYDGVRIGNVQSGQCDLGMPESLNCGSLVIDYAQNSLSFNTERPDFDAYCRPIAGRLTFTGGSQTTFLPTARLDFKLSDRIALSVFGSGIFSRGDFLYGEGERRANNDIQQVRTGIDLWGLANGSDWHAKIFYNGTERGAAGTITWPSDDRQTDKNAFVQCVLRKCFSTLYSLNLSGKLSYDKLSYTSTWGESCYGQTEVQVNSAHKFHINRWLDLSFAADIWWDNLISSNYNASRVSVSASAGAGFRLERFSADLALIYDGFFDGGAKNRNCLSPSVGLRYHALECLDVTSSVRRAYRVPTFNELYYVGYGNPELKPEDALLTDMGVALDKCINGSWSLSAKLDGFINILKDKITSAPSPEDPNYWQPYNIGKVISTGIDIAAGFGFIGSKWKYSLKASYTWQCAEDWAQDSYTYGRQIAYIPEHSLSLNANAKFRGWGAIAAWTLRAGRYDSTGRMPDWNTLDLTLSKDFPLRLCGPITIKLIGRNITDRHYELSSGYPMPGISIYGGIDFKF